MSKKVYIGDSNNIARNANKIYIGDSNNIARKVIKGYIGDSNNIARQFFDSEYEYLNYIEGSGTQYINTGTQFKSNTKIEMDFKFKQNSNGFLLGARSSGTENQLYVIYYSNDNFRISLLNAYNNLVSHSEIYNKRSKLIFDTSTISLDIEGNVHNYTSQIGSASYSSLPIFAFSCNTNNSSSLISAMELYSLKIYESNTLVKNFIPVKKKSNNEIGLLDLVTNTFYSNSGTGTFLYG